MIKSYEKSGKTEEEAISAALKDLGLERDDVSVEILGRAKSGFLGIGSSPAVIRISYETADEPVIERKPEPVPERRVEPKRESAAPKTPSFVSGDDVKKDAVNFVSGLLERMGVEAEIEVSERENGGLLLNLSGEGMGSVIGRRGETLDAIQHLTNYAVNKGGDKRSHISVDAESYRAKREESLAHLAEKMAAKVVKYKRSMALEPMNSYERHVIHTALQSYEGVSTNSIGTEPNRRVVVSYERPKQADDRPGSREWD
ncbi:MAG: RNA-binding cell elongation regulator Jag/EloR [Oscillospiraceae bacterium]